MCLVALLASCSGESRVVFEDGEASLPMRSLNSNGRKGTIANPGQSAYVYLALDERQIPRLALAKEQWGGVSCRVTLVRPLSTKAGSGTVPASSESVPAGSLAFGFLYQEDFISPGKLKESLQERALVRCSTPLERGGIPAGEEITLSMVIPDGAIRDFRGILLYSSVPVAVVSAGLQPMQIGFSGNTAFHCSSQGGLWDRSSPITALDFAAARKDFTAALSADKGMAPLITLSLSASPDMPEKASRQPQVKFEVGGESIRLRRAPNQRKASFHGDGLENPFGAFSVTQGGEMVEGVAMTLGEMPVGDNGDVLEPLVTDPGMIPRWPREAWRHEDYELFEWEQFPGILFFDTADYKVQDDFFKRLAFYTEKTGYIGTLVSDRDLAGQHGFNAHDYRSETLAAFFTLAESSNFPLNEKELLLRDILLRNGIIEKAANGYGVGYGAVISLSQESAMYLRHTFIAHEGFHGIFFVDEEFREAVSVVYGNADSRSLRFLHRYFQLQASLNYNTDDTYLMHNEFMAYVMQQPAGNTGAYFADNLARRGSMLRSEPELCAYIQSSKGEGFRAASEALSKYVFGRWGLEAGRVSLVGR